MGLVDTNTCYYQFIYDENETHIFQYFVMRRLGICVKLEIYVALMFYVCFFIQDLAVPYSKKIEKFYFSLDSYATVVSWVVGNSRKD